MSLTGIARHRVEVAPVNIRKYGNKKKQPRGVAVPPPTSKLAAIEHVDTVDANGGGAKPRKASRRRVRQVFVSSESELGWEDSVRACTHSLHLCRSS